ncbi:DUF4845 domain-containing protein [Psychrobacter arenosus]|jgi:hypothetical protein|uniref:DUF4845 domain-containing protein n=1 Tax=Psychrobacter arenosus TaxID=256326 RepID=UPI00191923EE|nr:DUF4845 domain-containing protein [Psychrobacter arenosus]
MYSPKNSLPNGQYGASASGVIIFILVFITAVKLLLAIVPAQISNYQMSKLIAIELEKANSQNKTAAEFMSSLGKQLDINGSYDAKVEDIITFNNQKVGQLAVHKKYSETHNFFGNVDIVNRFEDDIPAVEDAK